MRKTLIFGNSGSGKSSLAKQICDEALAHLDLDTLAFCQKDVTQRRTIEASREDINAFIDRHDGWIIEGCYADLMQGLLGTANEVIFMNLPVEACQDNARNRPWEPHKYSSKAAQDKNLTMLLQWIADYETRTDTLSAQAHEKLYQQFSGNKIRIFTNGAYKQPSQA